MNREEALNFVLNLNEQERIDKLVELLAEKERVFDFVVKANDQKVKNEGPYVVMLVERESGIAYVPHFISKIQKVILIYLLMHPKGISFRAMLAHYDDIITLGRQVYLGSFKEKTSDLLSPDDMEHNITHHISQIRTALKKCTNGEIGDDYRISQPNVANTYYIPAVKQGKCRVSIELMVQKMIKKIAEDETFSQKSLVF
jgi:hypothetical protein